MSTDSDPGTAGGMVPPSGEISNIEAAIDMQQCIICVGVIQICRSNPFPSFVLQIHLLLCLVMSHLAVALLISVPCLR